MATPILELRNFSKRFRSHWTFRPISAVNDVSLQVFEGESFGFLGHNGAGKTTTIKSIVGLIHTSGGEILFQGKPLRTNEARSVIGYLPEHPYFYEHLTVWETMELFASLHGLNGQERRKRIEETLELVHLIDRNRSSVRALSKGLQQRLGLAQSIINRPKLLLLDEPFSGLDPIGRVEVRELLLSLRKQGTTIFLSSHILSDVEDICDRIAIMAKGRLQTVFSLSDTPDLFGRSYDLQIRTNPEHEEFVEKLKAKAIESSLLHTSQGDALTLRFESYEDAMETLKRAEAFDLQVLQFSSVGLSLETIFMAVTESSKAPIEDKGEPS